MKIIDCKEIKARKIPLLKQEVKGMIETPALAIIQVGNNQASNTYIKSKLNLCEELGIDSNHFKLHETTPYNEVKKVILNAIPKYDGLIIQLPLPKHLQPHEQQLLDLIPVEKDVDALSTQSIGLLHSGKAKYYPATAKACIDVLDEYGYDLTGKHVLIINRSALLGYPLFRMMTDLDATVTLCHSKTTGLQSMLESGAYDVVVSAVGIPRHFKNIHTDFILDIGINRDEDGKLCGDIDLDTCNAMYATTVGGGIGGVGQLTTLNLCLNTIKAGGMR